MARFSPTNLIIKSGRISELNYNDFGELITEPVNEEIFLYLPYIEGDSGNTSSKIKTTNFYIEEDYGEYNNLSLSTLKSNWRKKNNERFAYIDFYITDYKDDGSYPDFKIYTIVWEVDYDGQKQVYKYPIMLTSEDWDRSEYKYEASSNQRLPISIEQPTAPNATLELYRFSSKATKLDSIEFGSGRTPSYVCYAFASNTSNINDPVFNISSSDSWLNITYQTKNPSTGLAYTKGEENYAIITIKMTANEGVDRYANINISVLGNDDKYATLQIPVTQAGVAVPSTPSGRFYIEEGGIVENFKIKATSEISVYSFNIRYENCIPSTFTYDLDGLNGNNGYNGDGSGVFYCSFITTRNETVEARTYSLKYSIQDENGDTHTINITVEQDGQELPTEEKAFIKWDSNAYQIAWNSGSSQATNNRVEIGFTFGYIDPKDISVSLLENSTFGNNLTFYESQDSTFGYLMPTNTVSPQLVIEGDYSRGYGKIIFGCSTNNTEETRSCAVTLRGKSLITNNIYEDTLTLKQGRRPSSTVSLSETNVTIGSNGGTKIIVYSKEEETTVSILSSSDWVSATINDASQTINLNIGKNTSAQKRSGEVTIQSTIGTSNSYTTIYVTQAAELSPNEKPIWDDSYLEIETDKAFIDYSITFQDNELYVGRGFAFDGVVKIRLNEILKRYMEQNLEFNSSGFQMIQAGGYLNGELWLSDDEWQSRYLYRNVIVYDDCSYKPFDNFILKYPISNVLDKRQYFVCSVFDSIGTNGGTTFLMVANSLIAGNKTINNDLQTAILPLYNVNTLTYSASNSIDRGKATTVKVELTCNQYCLYYKNKRGGWDSCLFNDVTKQTDKITINSYQREAIAGTTMFGTNHYQKDITRTWQLKSGRLTDKQSLIFAEHLLSSNRAYLHIFETDEIIPVNITNSSVDYLTRRNNSRKAPMYTITVEDAQKKMIR